MPCGGQGVHRALGRDERPPAGLAGDRGKRPRPTQATGLKAPRRLATADAGLSVGLARDRS